MTADTAVTVVKGRSFAANATGRWPLLVGLGLLVGGALADVLDRQGGDDDGDLAQGAVAVGLEEHPGQARVDGQAR